MDNINHVKILFRFYSDVLEQETVETMWAIPIDESLGHYKLDSIPFYVPNIATDDIVHAEYDEQEEMLTYRETIEFSGNSTVWVVVMDDNVDVDDIRDVLHKLNGLSEALSDRYFAMEVLANTNYLLLKNKLNELRAEGIIDYAEPCLSGRHQY